jgi:hypothetical protein
MRLKYEMLLWHQKHTAGTILEISKTVRLFYRNHWGKNFSEVFIIKLEKEYQDRTFTVYKIGLFNLCLCLGISKDEDVF